MISRPSALLVCVLALWLLPIATLRADAPSTQPTTRRWTVDGVDRQARIYIPPDAATAPTPLVFGFHGHGGSMASYDANVRLEKSWPEAIIVYPQGLNTPGRLTDPDGKHPGWQSAPGEQGDRDLKFFDAMLASLEKDYDVDPDRIYVTGHSNGGTFTYVLWRARREQFAAFAPAASALTMITRDFDAANPDAPADHQPVLRPVLCIAGEQDPLVKFVWQQRTIEALKRINHCRDEGQPWDAAAGCTLYPSSAGARVVAYIHPGKHNLPPDAGAVIVKFFKQSVRPTTRPAADAARP